MKADGRKHKYYEKIGPQKIILSKILGIPLEAKQ